MCGRLGQAQCNLYANPKPQYPPTPWPVLQCNSVYHAAYLYRNLGPDPIAHVAHLLDPVAHPNGHIRDGV